MKIKKQKGSFQIDVKRLSLPYTVSDECPKCGLVQERDLNDHYLNYPRIGEPIEFWLHCDECSEEWCGFVKLDLKLTIVNEGETK